MKTEQDRSSRLLAQILHEEEWVYTDLQSHHKHRQWPASEAKGGEHTQLHRIAIPTMVTLRPHRPVPLP